jgi:RES domain-containing protein
VVIGDAADLSREMVSPETHPGWNSEDYAVSQTLGNQWYDDRASLILVVPSVLSPYETNILINQNHPEFDRLAVSEERPTALDRRLLLDERPA